MQIPRLQTIWHAGAGINKSSGLGVFSHGFPFSVPRFVFSFLSSCVGVLGSHSVPTKRPLSAGGGSLQKYLAVFLRLPSSLMLFPPRGRMQSRFWGKNVVSAT